MDYNELYELLRKEKYSDQLQSVPKDFVLEFATYLNEKKSLLMNNENLFSETSIAEKKQVENSVSLFKELILRRKRKILNLVFVASETGIMKKDFSNMLSFEQELFDKFIKSMEEADKSLQVLLNGDSKVKSKSMHSLIIINEDVEEFIDLNGKTVGPFVKGSLANVNVEIAHLLVSDGKATFVDE